MDMSQYLDVFLEESKEHLGNLNEQLLNLEKNPGNLAALNEIFRAAHTLKGMSSTMGFEDLADLTHHLEDVLSDLKEGLLQPDTYVVDTLFQCLDRVQSIISQIESNGSAEYNNQDLIAILNSIKNQNYTGDIQLIEDKQKPATAQTEEPSIELDFNEYELTVMEEAACKNYQIAAIRVAVDPGSLMKSVRAFMVFKVLEEDSEVIKSIPAVTDLEDGKFDETFDVVVITKTPLPVLIDRLEHISEIRVDSSHLVNIDQLPLHRDDIDVMKSDQKTTEQVDTKRNHKIKQTVRVDIDRLDNLMNLVGELVMHKGRLGQIASNRRIVELNETIEQIDRISTDLQSVVMKVRMVPIEQVFNRFPRMVRDLAKELNKEIEFIMEGKETELDRTVIDEIGDPLIHLLRNAIDHGLESPSVRTQKGKPRIGTIILRARHEGNSVFIEVEDDGAGIQIERVKNKAVAKGIITAKEAEEMTAEQAVDLLFSPGFSTAENITDVSGRGVGLDVVKSKIESLNGEIQVDSKPGQGTKFVVKLPLTLAIIQALMVAVRDEIYAIPLSTVNETTMLSSEDIRLIQNQEVIVLRGNVLPLYRLDSLLEVPGETQSDESYVVVVHKGNKQIGLVVDRLIGQQEIVIKSLGKVLAGTPGIAGAIVAGDGNVRLILDIDTLF
ncbi:MAG: chemotaxis protein CheW [Syntrophomonadaceae bacterium]|jgi:two-component system chemotaxis sensor kinase CheA|nr:chemotaxis protein CheA [Syntrophomonadaceae bacterium]HAA09091.1 chemotaxis protein CheA [Syntrophomonas sp.]